MRILIMLLMMCVARAVAAAPTDRIVLLFDTKTVTAPTHVCVITQWSSCTKNDLADNEKAECTRPLSQLQKNRLLESPLREEMGFRRNAAGDSDMPSSLLRSMQVLTRKPQGKKCTEDHPACRPQITVPPQLLDKANDAHIMCGDNKAAPDNGRVVVLFVQVQDPEPKTSPKEVSVSGTTVTLRYDRTQLRNQLDTKSKVFAEVIGGDYQPSLRTELGTTTNIKLALTPRCDLFVAQLPPRATKSWIERVDLKTSAEPATSCEPTDKNVETLDLLIPYTSSSKPKQLNVALSDATSKHKSDLEARWTSAFPPEPLTLQLKKVQFSWRNHCLAGTWPESVNDKDWGPSCPRATLVSATEACTLTTAPSAPELCHYTCVSPSPFSLPVPVRFDRVRALGKARQVVYGWDDRLSMVGETLTSFVGAKDRVLMVDFEDPNSWRDDHGNKLDTLSLVAPRGERFTIDLTAARRGERGPPRWMSMAAPDLACTDRFRIKVQGSRQYDEDTLVQQGGRIVVEEPRQYWSLFHYGLIIGLGDTWPLTLGDPDLDTSGRLLATGGAFGQVYFDGPLPVSLEFEALFQLTQTKYGLIVGPDDDETKLATVPFTRYDFKVGVMLWAFPRFHLGLSTGIGLGYPGVFGFFPATSRDEANRLVGSSRTSSITEGTVRIRLPSKCWLDLVLGIRAGEEHSLFKTDFTGGPRTEGRRIIEPSLIARFRFGLG